jgi:hypothetical protein
MKAARDKTKPRGGTGRTVATMAFQVRLTPDQHEAVMGRAERRDITGSAAMRELITLGQLLDSGEQHGVVVTDEAHELMGTAHGANVTFAAGVDPDGGRERLAAIGLEPWQVDSLASGALLICTTEQLARVAG